MGIKQGFVITGKGERWDYINWSNALIIIVDVISVESNRGRAGGFKKNAAGKCLCVTKIVLFSIGAGISHTNLTEIPGNVAQITLLTVITAIMVIAEITIIAEKHPDVSELLLTCPAHP